MYEDPARWGYLFQNYVLLTMMDVHNAKQVDKNTVLKYLCRLTENTVVIIYSCIINISEFQL